MLKCFCKSEYQISSHFPQHEYLFTTLSHSIAIPIHFCKEKLENIGKRHCHDEKRNAITNPAGDCSVSCFPQLLHYYNYS